MLILRYVNLHQRCVEKTGSFTLPATPSPFLPHLVPLQGERVLPLHSVATVATRILSRLGIAFL